MRKRVCESCGFEFTKHSIAGDGQLVWVCPEIDSGSLNGSPEQPSPSLVPAGSADAIE